MGEKFGYFSAKLIEHVCKKRLFSKTNALPGFPEGFDWASDLVAKVLLDARTTGRTLLDHMGSEMEHGLADVLISHTCTIVTKIDQA